MRRERLPVEAKKGLRSSGSHPLASERERAGSGIPGPHSQALAPALSSCEDARRRPLHCGGEEDCRPREGGKGLSGEIEP